MFSYEHLQSKRLKRAEEAATKEAKAKAKGERGRKGKDAMQEAAETTASISTVGRGRKRKCTALEVGANPANVEAGPSVPRDKVTKVSNIQTAEVSEVLGMVPVAKMY